MDPDDIRIRRERHRRRVIASSWRAGVALTAALALLVLSGWLYFSSPVVKISPSVDEGIACPALHHGAILPAESHAVTMHAGEALDAYDAWTGVDGLRTGEVYEEGPAWCETVRENRQTVFLLTAGVAVLAVYASARSVRGWLRTTAAAPE